MTKQEILNSNLNKTQKAMRLYDLGHTRKEVSLWVTNGNYGFAYNIWKKWQERTASAILIHPFNFSFERTFGIELEVFGPSRTRIITEARRQGLEIQDERYNHTTRGHWKIVSDSSISGRNGCEVVSPVLRGQDGIEQIKKICIALQSAGAKVNRSCGFHVHFGAQDFNSDQFKSIIKTYMNLESEFDAIMPSSRRANNSRYAKSMKSIGRNNSIEQAKTKVNSCNSLTDLSRLYNCRYFKLNLKSFERQGTIEFRQHSGTTSYSKIKNWVLILGRMMDYISQNGEANDIKAFVNESLYDYIEDRKVDLVA